jgi:hypothetical protein
MMTAESAEEDPDDRKPEDGRDIQIEYSSDKLYSESRGLLKMIVGVLTTCHTKYT